MAYVNFPLNVQIAPSRGTSHCVFAAKENAYQGMSPTFITPDTKIYGLFNKNCPPVRSNNSTGHRGIIHAKGEVNGSFMGRAEIEGYWFPDPSKPFHQKDYEQYYNLEYNHNTVV